MVVNCFFVLVPACAGFLAQVKKHFDEKNAEVRKHFDEKKVQVREHFEKKLEKPECHVEWEDVVTPHCKTSYEQVGSHKIFLMYVHKIFSSIYEHIAGVCGGEQGAVQDGVQHLLRN